MKKRIKITLLPLLLILFGIIGIVKNSNHRKDPVNLTLSNIEALTDDTEFDENNKPPSLNDNGAWYWYNGSWWWVQFYGLN